MAKLKGRPRRSSTAPIHRCSTELQEPFEKRASVLDPADAAGAFLAHHHAAIRVKPNQVKYGLAEIDAQNESVEKVGVGADLFSVTIHVCAKEAFRRNSA